MIAKNKKKPRILIVTPEITYLPPDMGMMSNVLAAKAGGLADVSASLVASLYELGADVHVAIPHYRKKFLHISVERLLGEELLLYKNALQQDRIHLAEDSHFYHSSDVYSNYAEESMKQAIAFQREVINRVIPEVMPDLIHCNDWMTGLIPAVARRYGIPSLMTIHNIHTQKVAAGMVEDRGIDISEFWKNLYYENTPADFNHARSMRIDFMTSGIFAAHHINTVSPTFLKEIVDGWFNFVPDGIRNEIRNKYYAGCADGILNSPDPSYCANDPALKVPIDANNIIESKRQNKVEFQKRMGLQVNPDAPIFFWPSRLDPVQKGCPILADLAYHVISEHWNEGLQIAIVANGPYQSIFRDIANFHGIQDRLAVVDFNENLSRLGYGASDFMLMPSLFEPCGLPQMISPVYGTLAVAHDTGGLHDTVHDLNVNENTGNGFAFKTYDTGGLWWAMTQAMAFYRLPREQKELQLRRIKQEAEARFNHKVTAEAYINVYEKMLQRPLIAN